MVDIRVKPYGKVLLIYAGGEVSFQDLALIEKELPGLVAKYPYVVFSFKRAHMEHDFFVKLLTFREAAKLQKKVKLLLPGHPRTDNRSVMEALDSFNTADTFKVSDIRKAQKDLKSAKKELSYRQSTFSNMLRRANNEAESDELLAVDEAQARMQAIQENIRRLRFLYSSVGGEVAKLSQDMKRGDGGSGGGQTEQQLKTLKSIQGRFLKNLKALGVVSGE